MKDKTAACWLMFYLMILMTGFLFATLFILDCIAFSIIILLGFTLTEFQISCVGWAMVVPTLVLYVYWLNSRPLQLLIEFIDDLLTTDD